VPPSCSRREAESAYHRLVFQWHPDLHAADGPDAVAAAEAKTRALNIAIKEIRRRADSSSTTGTRWWDGPAPNPDRDWFGNPVDESGQRPPEPTPCPLCGQMILDLPAFEAHLSARHPSHVRPSGRKRRRPGGTFVRGLRFLPSWFVGGIAVLLLLLADTTVQGTATVEGPKLVTFVLLLMFFALTMILLLWRISQD
jgi:hypothetical protein